jgi:CheY-like chemotaxis protein
MTRNILFVDDDQILQLAIKKRLAVASDSFSVILANDGFEAVKKLKKISVSLIIIDLIMPRMDGVSLLSHIRELYPDIPVVIISGVPETEARHFVTADGVIAYLSKPFETDQLLQIITNTLRQEAESGIMHQVSPAMFLQLMEMDAKTCTIRVMDMKSGLGGMLFFREGVLLDARIGELQGLAAAYKVFSWDEVTVFMRNSCTPRENVINNSLQAIIMGALAAKDEAEEVSTVDGGHFVQAPALSSPADSDGDIEIDHIGSGNSTRTGTAGRPQTSSALEEINAVLQRELESCCELKKLRREQSMDVAIASLNTLGTAAGFGCLKAGVIERDNEVDELLLPDNIPVIVETSRGCSREQLLKVLNTLKPIGAEL